MGKKWLFLGIGILFLLNVIFQNRDVMFNESIIVTWNSPGDYRFDLSKIQTFDNYSWAPIYLAGSEGDYPGLADQVLKAFQNLHPELKIEKHEVIWRPYTSANIEQVDGIKIFHHLKQ